MNSSMPVQWRDEFKKWHSREEAKTMLRKKKAALRTTHTLLVDTYRLLVIKKEKKIGKTLSKFSKVEKHWQGKKWTEGNRRTQKYLLKERVKKDRVNDNSTEKVKGYFNIMTIFIEYLPFLIKGHVDDNWKCSFVMISFCFRGYLKIHLPISTNFCIYLPPTFLQERAKAGLGKDEPSVKKVKECNQTNSRCLIPMYLNGLQESSWHIAFFF